MPLGGQVDSPHCMRVIVAIGAYANSRNVMPALGIGALTLGKDGVAHTDPSTACTDGVPLGIDDQKAKSGEGSSRHRQNQLETRVETNTKKARPIQVEGMAGCGVYELF